MTADATPSPAAVVLALSRLVRDRRAALGMSQDELGRRAGVSRETINRIEGGHRWPDLPLLVRTVTALGGRIAIEWPAPAAADAVPERSQPPARPEVTARIAEGLVETMGAREQAILHWTAAFLGTARALVDQTVAGGDISAADAGLAAANAMIGAALNLAVEKDIAAVIADALRQTGDLLDGIVRTRAATPAATPEDRDPLRTPAMGSA